MKSLTTWSSLTRISNLPIWRPASIYVVLVPVLVTIFETAPESIELPHFVPSLEINLILPFSWRLLYLAALLLIVGKVIQFLASPSLIKNFCDYSEFTRSGRGRHFLIEELTSYLPSREENGPDDEYFEEIFREYRNRFGGVATAGAEPPTFDIAKELSYLTPNLEASPITFWFSYDFCNYVNKPARVACFILFSVGIAMSLWVFLSGVVKVLPKLI